MNNQEKKKVEKPSRDPKSIKRDYNEFFQNKLALPDALKEKLTKEGKDWRFINSLQFRDNGGMHASHWVPYKVEGNPNDVGLFGTTPEGYIQRGDLILGVRDKEITRAHKRHLAEKNKAYQGYNKEKAKEIRKVFKDAGMEAETKVHEGYEEGEND